MELNKQTRNHILQIVIVAILVYCGVQRFDIVIEIFNFVMKIINPFLVGAVIAFILNVPMKFIEKNIFVKKDSFKKIRRPLAYVITLLLVFGVFAIAMAVVIPELVDTFAVLVEKIPETFYGIQEWALQLPEKYPTLQPALAELEIDWAAMSNMAVGFVKNIATSVVNSGIGMITNIIGGVTTFVIAFVFSIYLLMQKEKLLSQVKQVMYAVLPNKATEKIIAVGTLSNKVFTNFLSGQCLEAVILGVMFVITMTIFRMPYAMLTGIVIAITALVPIFGAFVGCAVGAFLIFIENPLQAVWFIVLFLVLQQIEGNLIYPYVVGNSVGLPSIWVLAAVTVGGNLFGIAGILFFIPFCSVLYTLFREFIKKRLEKRQVPEGNYRKETQTATEKSDKIKTEKMIIKKKENIKDSEE